MLFTCALSLLLGCENPGAKVESATVEAPSGQATETPTPDADTGDAKAGPQLPITPENSKVGFVGAKVTQSHEGGFSKFAGTIDVREPIEASIVQIEIETASLFADDPKLQKHLKSPDFFDVAKFPSATFKSTKIEKTAQGHTITGNLTLHGQTKTISFPATVSARPDGGVTATSEFAIDRKDFGIVYPGMPDDLIRDKVVIRLNLDVPSQS